MHHYSWPCTRPICSILVFESLLRRHVSLSFILINDAAMSMGNLTFSHHPLLVSSGTLTTPFFFFSLFSLFPLSALGSLGLALVTYRTVDWLFPGSANVHQLNSGKLGQCYYEYTHTPSVNEQSEAKLNLNLEYKS